MICMIEYEEGEELRTMPCMHFFHKECIDEWLQINPFFFPGSGPPPARNQVPAHHGFGVCAK